jgi:hypothetical protein
VYFSDLKTGALFLANFPELELADAPVLSQRQSARMVGSFGAPERA